MIPVISLGFDARKLSNEVNRLWLVERNIITGTGVSQTENQQKHADRHPLVTAMHSKYSSFWAKTFRMKKVLTQVRFFCGV